MIQATFSRVITGLHLVILSDETVKTEDRFNGYKYLIRSYGCTSFTAFKTKSGMKQWLKNTGLKIGKRFTYMKGAASFNLDGQYIDNCTVDKQGFQEAEFSSKYGQTVVLSNGEYTKGLVESSSQGNVIHYMNCNYQRTLYDYFEMKNIYG